MPPEDIYNSDKHDEIFRGRGAKINPTDRFTPLNFEKDLSSSNEEDEVSPKTEIRRENVKSALTKNDSPDISFTYSVNPYRGCEHGCVYCYARPTHEYLGMSLGLDFETKLIAKMNVAEKLREDLAKRSYVPEAIAMSGVTDCYQPIERNLGLTRGCLEVFKEFRNPVIIITKNSLLLRDLDLLRELNEFHGVSVAVSITTLDSELAAKLEPRASHPQQRLRLVRELAQAGIPVGVMMAPVIPGLTDEEIPELLKTVSEAGASFASYVMLRLPYRVDELFIRWLEVHYPERSKRVQMLIRQVRGGEMKDSRFGSRMSGEGVYAEQISKLFSIHKRKHGLTGKRIELSTASFKVPNRSGQLSLFGE